MLYVFECVWVWVWVCVFVDLNPKHIKQAAGKNADQPRVMIFTEKNVRVIMQSYIPVYVCFF